MSRWGLVETVKLSELGDEWADCYIKMTSVPFKTLTEFMGLDEKDSAQILKANTDLVELFKGSFVEGKIYDGKSVIDMKKEDFDDIPASVFMMITSFLFQRSQTSQVKQASN